MRESLAAIWARARRLRVRCKWNAFYISWHPCCVPVHARKPPRLSHFQRCSVQREGLLTRTSQARKAAAVRMVAK